MRLEGEEGYLDQFFDVLDVHDHPCILLGEWAVRWMGAAPVPVYPISFLVRSSQYDAVARGLNDKPHWEETEIAESTQKREYAPPHPRAFRRVQGCAVILLHCEESEKLLVDPPAQEASRPFQLEISDCMGFTRILVDEDMNPPLPSPSFTLFSEAIKRGKSGANTRCLCQSPGRTPQTKIYIPTISRYLEALVSQIKVIDSISNQTWRLGPRYTLDLLTRYLYLEAPQQRRKIFKLVNQDIRDWLENYFNKYGRKPTEALRLELLRQEDELANAAEMNSQASSQ